MTSHGLRSLVWLGLNERWRHTGASLSDLLWLSLNEWWRHTGASLCSDWVWMKGDVTRASLSDLFWLGLNERWRHTGASLSDLFWLGLNEWWRHTWASPCSDWVWMKDDVTLGLATLLWLGLNEWWRPILGLAPIGWLPCFKPMLHSPCVPDQIAGILRHSTLDQWCKRCCVRVTHKTPSWRWTCDRSCSTWIRANLRHGKV